MCCRLRCSTERVAHRSEPRAIEPPGFDTPLHRPAIRPELAGADAMVPAFVVEDKELHHAAFAGQHGGVNQQDTRNRIGGTQIGQAAVEAGLNVVASDTAADEVKTAVGIDASGLRRARRIGDREA